MYSCSAFRFVLFFTQPLSGWVCVCVRRYSALWGWHTSALCARLNWLYVCVCWMADNKRREHADEHLNTEMQRRIWASFERICTRTTFTYTWMNEWMDGCAHTGYHISFWAFFDMNFYYDKTWHSFSRLVYNMGFPFRLVAETIYSLIHNRLTVERNENSIECVCVLCTASIFCHSSHIPLISISIEPATWGRVCTLTHAHKHTEKIIFSPIYIRKIIMKIQQIIATSAKNSECDWWKICRICFGGELRQREKILNWIFSVPFFPMYRVLFPFFSLCY